MNEAKGQQSFFVRIRGQDYHENEDEVDQIEATVGQKPVDWYVEAADWVHAVVYVTPQAWIKDELKNMDVSLDF